MTIMAYSSTSKVAFVKAKKATWRMCYLFHPSVLLDGGEGFAALPCLYNLASLT